MSDKVIVYSTSTCPWCARVKSFLKEKGVKFKDVNVEDDQKAAREMVDKSGQMGVPVIDFNGKIIVGFDETALEKEIGKGKK